MKPMKATTMGIGNATLSTETNVASESEEADSAEQKAARSIIRELLRAARPCRARLQEMHCEIFNI